MRSKLTTCKIDKPHTVRRDCRVGLRHISRHHNSIDPPSAVEIENINYAQNPADCLVAADHEKLISNLGAGCFSSSLGAGCTLLPLEFRKFAGRWIECYLFAELREPNGE